MSPYPSPETPATEPTDQLPAQQPAQIPDPSAERYPTYVPAQPAYTPTPPAMPPSANDWVTAGGTYGAPPPRRSRVTWVYPAVAIVMIALLAGAFALGHAGGSSSPTPALTRTNGQPAPTVAVPPAALDLQQTVINVIQTVQPSVVEIQGTSATGGDIGSGEILTNDGYIVTNDHVVAAASTFVAVLSNGKQYPARVIGTDPQDDLALLKINATGLQPITLGDSSKVAVGQFAIAIGSPLGLTQSATFGIVSAVNRAASEAPGGPAQTLTGLIQTSAPINPGNSGGALVDLQGRLIGIPTLGAVSSQTGGAADGIGFAIPSDRVKYVTDQLIKNGKLVNSGQGFLGIAGEDVTPQLAAADNLPVQSGVLISSFANDAAGSSPAQNAGI
ncbi:MAG: trypsin-like peptidase domain-containing protein, partial [Ktedonobacterales bacterium]